MPPGWKAERPEHEGPAFKESSSLRLVPEKDAAETEHIVLATAVLDPDQHPGLPPGEDPGGAADRTGTFTSIDRDSPLGQGRRPDGRPYVWRTRC